MIPRQDNNGPLTTKWNHRRDGEPVACRNCEGESDGSNNVPCQNCGGSICLDCQDRARNCSAECCRKSICEDCLEGAWNRPVGRLIGGIAPREYLCASCCAAQTVARIDLAVLVATAASALNNGSVWLSDICEKLEEALEKAKEVL